MLLMLFHCTGDTSHRTVAIDPERDNPRSYAAAQIPVVQMSPPSQPAGMRQKPVRSIRDRDDIPYMRSLAIAIASLAFAAMTMQPYSTGKELSCSIRQLHMSLDNARQNCTTNQSACHSSAPGRSSTLGAASAGSVPGGAASAGSVAGGGALPGAVCCQGCARGPAYHASCGKSVPLEIFCTLCYSIFWLCFIISDLYSSTNGRRNDRVCNLPDLAGMPHGSTCDVGRYCCGCRRACP